MGEEDAGQHSRAVLHVPVLEPGMAGLYNGSVAAAAAGFSSTVWPLAAIGPAAVAAAADRSNDLFLHQPDHHHHEALELTTATAAAAVLTSWHQSAGSNRSPAAEQVAFIMDSILIPAIGLFGVLGNALNLTILSCRYQKREVDVLEKGALLGLIALALSDMLFCFGVLPNAIFHESKTLFETKNVQFYYQVYGSYYYNVFIKTSTWLTMVIATARYVGICHPMHARLFVGLTGTKVAIACTFVLWIALLLPQLWNYSITEMVIPPDNTTMYLLDMGLFSSNLTMKLSFTYVWAILGYFVPVAILAFCNICLILALRESTRLRERSVRSYASHARDAHSKITMTLICLVAMFLLLVSPSEILHFYSEVGPRDHFPALEMTMIVTNVLQTINFSCHFVLYCAVNVTFRRTLVNLFCSLWLKVKGTKRRGSRKYRRSFQSSTRQGQSFSKSAIETNV